MTSPALNDLFFDNTLSGDLSGKEICFSISKDTKAKGVVSLLTLTSVHYP